MTPEINPTTYLSTPAAADQTIPFTTTGPTTLNIFTAVPMMSPSERNSIAALDMALANPVIGRNEPAPPCLAMTSYTPRPVRSMAATTSAIDAYTAAS